MKISELINGLSKALGKKITQSEIAKALHTTGSVISNKKNRGTEVTVSELLACCKYFDCPVDNIINEEDKVQDSVEIIYYEDKGLGDLIKHPDVTSVWRDRQIVYRRWQKNKENLRTISMFGNSMDGGVRPIKDGDMLTIDTSMTNTLASGIYVYKTNKKNKLYVAYIHELSTKIIFKFANPQCEDIEMTPEELEAINFQIVGRVIHNETELW